MAGAGVFGQLGVKLETTAGTAVTVDKFPVFNSEGLEFDPMFLEPEGLRTSSFFKLGARLVQSRKQVSGSIELPYATRLMGTFWKAALGSTVTTPTLVLGSAYKQIHQTGDVTGKTLTVQVGRPEPVAPYTVQPHTFRGCFVTGWEFSVSDNEVAKLKLDLDGWDESTSTALAIGAYIPAEVFHFAQCTALKLGVTIAGTTELTASSGTAVAAVVKKLTLKGDNAAETDRVGAGNAGVKKEQIHTGTVITGTFEVEYSKTEFYDVFKAGTATSLQVLFEGSVISGTDKNTLEFIAPEIRFKKVTPTVDGPDIVKANVDFEVYSNGTLNPFQVKIVSADSASI